MGPTTPSPRSGPRVLRLELVSLLLAALALAGPATAQGGYQLFEAGASRPLAVTPDETRLLAVDTPDDQVEIFDVAPDGTLTHAASVQVGMRPVAVAVRSNSEAWVVNHLSDSISVLDLSGTPRVVRTLHVGDEPGDLVFAGTNLRWAFVTTAHRGQNGPNDGRDFDQEGIGRADVWVFDATSLGSGLGGDEAAVLTLFGDKPRALAVSPDGDTVYAAIFRSGNRTTVVNEGLVCDGTPGSSAAGPCTINGLSIPGGYPPPHENVDPEDRRETGLIVQFDRPGATPGAFADELDRDWSGVVKFDLPDRDVFEIDATTNPPSVVDASASCADGAGCWARVGTTVFNMVANPVSGKVYVSNTEAQNHVRFEGPGTIAAAVKPIGEPATVQGNLAQARVTVLDGANVDVRHLNKHLDYSVRPAPPADKAKSLAGPMGMAVTPDGATLYLAAFGSGKVGVFSTSELENDTFTPDAADHIALSGGGPTGLLLLGDRLYVATRFDNSLAVVDTGSETEIQKLALHSPEPASVTQGRPFLYDARLTSSNGEASCSSCHIFGDMDDLGWDLGNPDDVVVPITNAFNPVVPPNQLEPARDYHPMKGPMTTQSLRGLENHGPQHWRGDRQGNEVQAFEAFNVAFPGLVGRDGQLDPTDMTRFRRFALELRYPPNPIRQLDNSLRPDEANGRDIYLNDVTDIVATCNGCHVLDAAQGFFGGNGEIVFDGEPQHMKTPHLRNAYQKVGMFGMSEPTDGGVAGLQFTGDFSHQGPQIRGFGFLHDGSVDSIGRFLGLDGFSLNASEEDDMSAFMMAFDSDFAPIVGQQVTLSSVNGGVAGPRIDLLIERAEADFTSQVLGGVVKECDLVASVVENGRERGYLYDPLTQLFEPDDAGAALSDGALRAKASVAGQEITYTCVPPGSGERLAHDRDQDALLDGFETGTGVFVSESDTGTSPALFDTDGDGAGDGVEVAAGSDPLDPLSLPSLPALSPLGALLVALLLGVAGAIPLAGARPRKS